MPARPVVVLTRETDDNLLLKDRLAEKGIDAISYPCVGFRSIPESEWKIESGRDLDRFRVVVFTSRRGVTGFGEMDAFVSDPRRFIGAVGRATADEIEKQFGEVADLVADPQTGEGLARSLTPHLDPGEVILHVRGSKSTGDFKTVLRESGFEVEELIVYESVRPELSPLNLEPGSLVVFASPSAARHYFDVNRSGKKRNQYVTIGPTTRRFLDDLGLERVTEADRPETADLVRKIAEIVTREDKE